MSKESHVKKSFNFHGGSQSTDDYHQENSSFDEEDTDNPVKASIASKIALAIVIGTFAVGVAVACYLGQIAAAVTLGLAIIGLPVTLIQVPPSKKSANAHNIKPASDSSSVQSTLNALLDQKNIEQTEIKGFEEKPNSRFEVMANSQHAFEKHIVSSKQARVFDHSRQLSEDSSLSEDESLSEKDDDLFDVSMDVTQPAQADDFRDLNRQRGSKGDFSS